MMRRIILLLMAMAMTLVVASGLAWAVTKVGTNGRDTLRGTNGNDTLVGKGGNDWLDGRAGKDNIIGGPGKDVLGGDAGGDKHLVGGPGNDAVLGGKGTDNLLANAGNDFMADITWPDNDHLSAGDGNDVIVVTNLLYPFVKGVASKDRVTCGGGYDRVLADSKDSVAPNCEKVVRKPLVPGFFRLNIPGSFFRGLPPGFNWLS